jgi:acyl-CoA thioesterase FadM
LEKSAAFDVQRKRPFALRTNGRRVVLIDLWVFELSLASAWMEFRFENGAGKLAATGRQRGLFIDLESGRPRRMSAEDRARFEPFRAEAENQET